MADDIVQRLRRAACAAWFVGQTRGGIEREAADEIERLRAELSKHQELNAEAVRLQRGDCTWVRWDQVTEPGWYWCRNAGRLEAVYIHRPSHEWTAGAYRKGWWMRIPEPPLPEESANGLS